MRIAKTDHPICRSTRNPFSARIRPGQFTSLLSEENVLRSKGNASRRNYGGQVRTIIGVRINSWGASFKPTTSMATRPQPFFSNSRRADSCRLCGHHVLSRLMPDGPLHNSKIQRRLPPLLRRAWYSLNQTFRHRIGHLGITPDQYSILRWLTEGDSRGLTQQTLTDLMASDPNTITSILKRMEHAGLISRRIHESDKRARRVRVEPEGRRIFSEALKEANDLQTSIMNVLPRTRRELFLKELERVADACMYALDSPRTQS